DTQLLLVTVVLVLVLLGLIYRSPVVALIPLVVVGFSYVVAQGFIYLYAKSGATVSTNSTSILVVLMFGVGTDYCLLLVSRYREELRRFEDKHEAMQRAVRRAGPAILASGMTVTLSMLVLLVAESGSIHSLGPVSAIGVASVLRAGPVRAADVLATQRRLATLHDVAGSVPTGQRSRDGRIAEPDVVLRSDPYKSAALGVVPRLRSAVRNVAPGVTALVGGGSAIN